MENLKNHKLRAYILLEALVALAVFALIATLVLDNIRSSRQAQRQILAREEVLRVAQMALQTQQDQLSLNGVTVRVVRTAGRIQVYEGGQEVLHVERR